MYGVCVCLKKILRFGHFPFALFNFFTLFLISSCALLLDLLLILKRMHRPLEHTIQYYYYFMGDAVMLEKFRLSDLTDYSRVMYLDYDIMPTCNLDYLFDLSDPLPESSGLTSSAIDDTIDATIRLKENIILAYQSEPSSGGIFVLKPNATDYSHIQRIIYEKEVRSLEQPYPHWDPILVSTTGWC